MASRDSIRKILKAVDQVDDGGYVASGYIYIDGSHADFWLIKVAADGGCGPLGEDRDMVVYGGVGQQSEINVTVSSASVIVLER